MTFARKLQLGDSGEDVVACKERLQILGYYVGDMDNPGFDELFENVVKKFQTDTGIYSYGVLDNATMLELYNRTNGVQIEEDTQLQTAVSYLKTK